MTADRLDVVSTVHNVSFEQGGDNSWRNSKYGRTGSMLRRAGNGKRKAGINAVEKAGGKFPCHCLKVFPKVIPLPSLKDAVSEPHPRMRGLIKHTYQC